MEKSRYNRITSQFHKRTVLVIGDLMLDKYLWGHTDRISPEAPVPIVEVNNIDITKVQGTGKAGRISKGDLINLMGNSPQPSKRKITHGQEERVKMSRLRMNYLYLRAKGQICEGYKLFINSEEELSRSEPAIMSKLTKQILLNSKLIH